MRAGVTCEKPVKEVAGGVCSGWHEKGGRTCVPCPHKQGPPNSKASRKEEDEREEQNTVKALSVSGELEKERRNMFVF